MSGPKEICACLQVQFNPKKTTSNRLQDRWNCTLCGAPFVRDSFGDAAIPRPLELDTLHSVDKIFIAGYEAKGDPEGDGRRVTEITVEVNNGPEQRFVPARKGSGTEHRELLVYLKKRIRSLSRNVWEIKGDPSTGIDPKSLGNILEEYIEKINEVLDQ